MRILVWAFRAFIFFALFAFALNNQQFAEIHWFFGYAWNAPMVIVVLAAFACGIVVGVLAMMPSWWRQRRRAHAAEQAEAAAPISPTPNEPTAPRIPDGI